jgi:hypothetical protein
MTSELTQQTHSLAEELRTLTDQVQIAKIQTSRLLLVSVAASTLGAAALLISILK